MRTWQWIVAVGLACSTKLVTAQEVCGLADVKYENLLKDGYENSNAPDAKTTLKPKPKNVPKRAMAEVKIIKGFVAPTIAIQYPSNGAAIAGGVLQVKGTFTGDATVGITVNGDPAFIVGNEFVSKVIRAESAANTTLTVVATNLAGQTATQSISVDTTIAALPIALVSTAGGSFAGHDIDIRARYTGSTALQAATIYYDGDSVSDYTGVDLSNAPRKFRYNIPGIYRARLSVTTQSLPDPPQTSSYDLYLAAIDFTAHRERPCVLYGILRDRLTNNDTAGALRVFASDPRMQYQAFFDALGSNKPTMATRLGTIGNGVFGLKSAEVAIIADEAGTNIVYPMKAAQGADGVWRIESL